MLINARRLDWDQQKEVLILLAIRQTDEPETNGKVDAGRKTK